MKSNQSEKLILNTLTAWISTAIGMIIGFVLTPFLLKTLGNELYALQRISDNLMSWCVMLAIPIGSYVSRSSLHYFELKKINEMNNTLSNALTISIASCIFIIIPLGICVIFPEAILGVNNNFLFQAKVAISIAGCGGIITIILRVFECSIFITRSFYLKNLENIFSRIAGSLLIVIYFSIFEPSLLFWLSIVTFLPLLVNIFWTLPLAARSLPIKIKIFHIDKPELHKAIKFILGTSIGSVGSLLFSATDSLLIANIFGAEKLPAYDLGARWMPIVITLVDSFVKALSPNLVVCAAQKKYVEMGNKLAIGTRHSLLICIIPAITLSITAQPFIIFWVGEEFVSISVPVMRLLLASAVLTAPQMLAYQVITGMMKTREVALISITAGLLNLSVSIFLATQTDLGIVGVALGTLLATIVGCTFTLPYIATRYCRIPWLLYLREAWIRPLIATTICLSLGNPIVNSWDTHSILDVILLVVLISLIFSIIIFLIGLNTKELKDTRAWIMAKSRNNVE